MSPTGRCGDTLSWSMRALPTPMRCVLTAIKSTSHISPLPRCGSSTLST